MNTTKQQHAPLSHKEAQLWRDISSLHWESDFDYKRIRLVQLGQFLGKKRTAELKEFAQDKQRELMERLAEYSEEVHHHPNYWCVGDDSFNDLTAHIVGLGRSMYYAVWDYPEIAKDMADSRAYRENFLYSFLDK